MDCLPDGPKNLLQVAAEASQAKLVGFCPCVDGLPSDEAHLPMTLPLVNTAVKVSWWCALFADYFLFLEPNTDVLACSTWIPYV